MLACVLPFHDSAISKRKCWASKATMMHIGIEAICFIACLHLFLSVLYFLHSIDRCKYPITFEFVISINAITRVMFGLKLHLTRMKWFLLVITQRKIYQRLQSIGYRHKLIGDISWIYACIYNTLFTYSKPFWIEFRKDEKCWLDFRKQINYHDRDAALIWDLFFRVIEKWNWEKNNWSAPQISQK